jgi:hypothetical protein
MINKLKNNRALAFLEYVMLIIIVLSGLAIMKTYVFRSMNGNWKEAGDSLAFGRQYQSGKTTACAFSQINAEYGYWYDETCYYQAVSLCKPEDIECENKAKKTCGEASKSYCCENNKEEKGHSNCS